ncbi:hypothetical protein EC912_11031 [Luteibacter rhizovicinus]|uniref:Sel1 repeat-containing protein n=1 Tax=Luteibacter rhizovicinus TaxID=242606 RepID=A0A4R3YHQ3_9GAMM|nr:SEL1-like repeat protein [Luteibacter rhizovicinus]TCV91601.1 hypothetical protein EC912_11031 [Luteibacter rhizovicinus]
MSVRSSLTVLVVALTATFAAQSAERPVPLPDQGAAVAKSLMPCPGGLERFLPGEYYFCAAARDFWAGHQGMAVERLKDASRWASKPAQYALGIMYFNGDRVAANRPLGLAWLAIAAERHDVQYEPAFISAYRIATPAERDQANAYWNELKPVYGDKVAAVRAKKRFDREMNQIAWAANFGGSIFVDGLTSPMGAQPGDTRFMASGFGFGRMMEYKAANYFYGWEGEVTVGEAQLVPLRTLIAKGG